MVHLIAVSKSNARTKLYERQAPTHHDAQASGNPSKILYLNAGCLGRAEKDPSDRIH